MRSGWRRVFCRTAVDQTVACSSGGGQAPEGAHFRGIFSGTLIAIRQFLSRPLKILMCAWTAIETNHSPIRIRLAEVVKDGGLLEAD